VRVALIRFILIGLLVFVIMRFAARLIAELRSFASGRPNDAARPPRRRAPRDIQDATFEDVTGKNNDQKPQP